MLPSEYPMQETLLNYILPAFMLLTVIAVIYFKIRAYSNGDKRPANIFLVFFLIAFGPSLIFAIIHDDSNSALFGGSVLIALIVSGILVYRMLKKK